MTHRMWVTWVMSVLIELQYIILFNISVLCIPQYKIPIKYSVQSQDKNEFNPSIHLERFTGFGQRGIEANEINVIFSGSCQLTSA